MHWCLLVFVSEKPIQHLAVTGAGSLKCRHIFHLVAVHKKKDWCRTVNICLGKAEDMGLRSIAMPALGTGLHHRHHPAPKTPVHYTAIQLRFEIVMLKKKECRILRIAA